MKNLKFEYVNYKGARKIRTIYPHRIFYGKTPNITTNEWILEGFDVEKKATRQFVMKHILRVVDENIQRFLCVTVFVINKDKKLLMIKHKKSGRWCPPGGKVDNNETPDEAAMRECFEETGIKIKLIGLNNHHFTGELITPMGSQCNVIDKGERDHVDLSYLAIPQSDELKISEREASDIGWFSLDEIKQLNTFESVPYFFKKGLLIIEERM